MPRFIKSILFLVLVVALNGMSNKTLAQQEVSGRENIVLDSSNKYFNNSSDKPGVLEVELGSIGLGSHQTPFSREQRTNVKGSVPFVKYVIQKLAEREALLSKRWEELSDISILSSITHPICEYYVFALRHIII